METITNAGDTAAPNKPHQIAPSEPDRFIADPECRQISGLGRVTRWRLEKRGQFPRRRQLSPGRVGWLLSEVLIWQRDRAAA